MHTISVEIYSENGTSSIFYKPGLTQPWNTVHQGNTVRSIGKIEILTFRAIANRVTRYNL